MRVSAYIKDEKTYRKLEHLANKNNITKSEMIEKLIQEYECPEFDDEYKNNNNDFVKLYECDFVDDFADDFVKLYECDFVNEEKRNELYYSKKLAKEINGKREISLTIGRIDILTKYEIIEVKSVICWKHALGQILVYSLYYPSHQKRIHLFGDATKDFLELIKDHCSQFDVKVTWDL